MSLPKQTNNQPQELHLTERTITVPPNTVIFGSVLGAHTYPSYWEDPLTWKPSRWITTQSSPSRTGQARETIMTPKRITYFPWSDGPQNCPGQKFSQVEFVVVLATLLRAHRIRPISKPGESLKDTQDRVRAVANDTDAIMILRVSDADQVQVELEKV